MLRGLQGVLCCWRAQLILHCNLVSNVLDCTCQVWVRCVLCRDQAQDVLNLELADLRRRLKREGWNTNYLKAVILGGLQSGELLPKPSMVQVLARLLEFSPGEWEPASQLKTPKPWKLLGG